jgi:hypothetical protein
MVDQEYKLDMIITFWTNFTTDWTGFLISYKKAQINV